MLVALNDILTAELTGINQYFVHFRMLENWGYKRLAQQKREESIEEMKHADKVIERILYLDGVPNLQRLGPVRVGEEPIEMHKLDLTLEREAVARLNQAIALASIARTPARASCSSTCWSPRKNRSTGWRRSSTS